MIIDCDSCAVRDVACGECVVGVLLGVPSVPSREAGTARSPAGGPPGASDMQLDAPERRALQVLADQGLVPRLRLVAGPGQPADERRAGPGRVRDAG